MRNDSFRDYVLDQLRGLEGVTARAMFGGYGLYRRHAIFGIVFHGRLYFKTNPETRLEYERRGARRFRPNERQTLTSYYEVPADVLEDRVLLTEWAERALG